MASGSSRKKGTLHDYMQRSSSSEKEKSRPRVQSGPLRHSSATKSSRYSPVTGKKETKSVGHEGESACTATASKGM